LQFLFPEFTEGETRFLNESALDKILEFAELALIVYWVMSFADISDINPSIMSRILHVIQ